jgi:hypothetical protein
MPVAWVFLVSSVQSMRFDLANASIFKFQVAIAQFRTGIEMTCLLLLGARLTETKELNTLAIPLPKRRFAKIWSPGPGAHNI